MCDVVVHLSHFGASKIDWYICSVFCVMLFFSFILMPNCLSGGYVLYTYLVLFIGLVLVPYSLPVS